MEELARRWTLVAVLGLSAWTACTTFLWAGNGLPLAVQWGVPSGVVLGLFLLAVRMSLHLNRGAREQELFREFGGANLLTLSRGGATAVLAGFLLPDPPGTPLIWLATGLFLFVALGDILDGHWARMSGRETLLGKRLDGMVDALVILVGVAIAVQWGRLPQWFLTLGLAPYLFGMAAGLRRRLGAPLRPLPRRPSRRLVGAVVYGFVAVSLSPLSSREVLAWAAVPVALMTLASFLADWRVLAGSGLRGDVAPDPAEREISH
jgi:CDP-diacylglycerol---glycerol-3-phosphate 3-phosphatidyltransferase